MLLAAWQLPGLELRIIGDGEAGRFTCRVGCLPGSLATSWPGIENVDGLPPPMQNALTRTAGGRQRTSAPPAVKVVVDMREFMSSLPTVLYQQVSGS